MSYTILHIFVVTLNGVSPIQCWISLVFYQGVLPGKTDRLAPTDGVSLIYVFHGSQWSSGDPWRPGRNAKGEGKWINPTCNASDDAGSTSMVCNLAARYKGSFMMASQCFV